MTRKATTQAQAIALIGQLTALTLPAYLRVDIKAFDA
jgi:hypothetical protein